MTLDLQQGGSKIKMENNPTEPRRSTRRRRTTTNASSSSWSALSLSAPSVQDEMVPAKENEKDSTESVDEEKRNRKRKFPDDDEEQERLLSSSLPVTAINSTVTVPENPTTLDSQQEGREGPKMKMENNPIEP
jgi:hypothetical protein